MYMDKIPLREGVDALIEEPVKETVGDRLEEDREFGGRPRPPWGSGWWGRGPPAWNGYIEGVQKFPNKDARRELH